MKNKTYAIHIVSESCDHYTFCFEGSIKEVVEKVATNMGDEMGWADSINVATLDTSDGSKLLKELYKKQQSVRKKVDS